MPKPSDLLSPHFTVEEFTESATATARGIWNWPGDEQFVNLTRLAEEFEKVRALCGSVPFIHATDVEARKKLTKLKKAFGIISCAYRSPELNKVVGGAKESAHMDGRAIDFDPPSGWSHDDLQKAILSDRSIAVDKIIEERTADGKHSWLHFQIAGADKKPRRLGIDITVDALGGKPTRTMKG